MNFLAEKLEARALAFIVLIGVYFAVNLATRLSLPNALEIDEAAQILMSQWYALGYDSQPPFYNWVQHLVIDGIGQSLFALSLVKNLVLFLSYVLYYLAARQLLTSRSLAAAAALGLLTIPEIGWLAQRDLTHSNASLLAACLFLYGLSRCLQRPTVASYLVTGIAIGVGLMSKYNFSILCFCACLAVLVHPLYRQRIFDRRILITAAVALVIILPHGLWLAQNFDIAFQDTAAKLAADAQRGTVSQIGAGLGELVITIISYCALTLVVYTSVLSGPFRSLPRAGNSKTRLIEIMFAVLIVLLLCMVLFAGTAQLKVRWVSPVLFMLPLYLCLKIEASGIDGSRFLRRLLPVILVLMVLIPASLVVRIVAAGPMGTHPKLTVPYQGFVEEIVRKPGIIPALVIAGDALMAGNLRMQMPDVAVDTQTYPLHSPAFSWSSQNPILVVWRANEETASIPPGLLSRLEERVGTVPPLEPQVIALPYLYGNEGDGFRFGYAWVRKP